MIGNRDNRNATTYLPGYRKIIAWQFAEKFAKETYRLSSKFPKEELYGLTSQLRRAALSVVLNIIEGYSRNNKKEFSHFLRIALGSLAEAGYLLEFSLGQKYLSESDFEYLNELKEHCGRLLWRLYKSKS